MSYFVNNYQIIRNYVVTAIGILRKKERQCDAVVVGIAVGWLKF